MKLKTSLVNTCLESMSIT